MSLIEIPIKLKMVNHLSQSQMVTSAPNLSAGLWLVSLHHKHLCPLNSTLQDTKGKHKCLRWSSRKTSGMTMHRDRLRPVTYCQTEVWTSANKPQAKAHTLCLFLVHLLPSCFENYCPTAENLGWWLARHFGFDILPVVYVLHPISMAEITNPERIETQVYTFQTFLPAPPTPVALVYIPFSSTGLPTKESKCGRSTHWGPQFYQIHPNPRSSTDQPICGFLSLTFWSIPKWLIYLCIIMYYYVLFIYLFIYLFIFLYVKYIYIYTFKYTDFY